MSTEDCDYFSRKKGDDVFVSLSFYAVYPIYFASVRVIPFAPRGI